MYNNLIGIAPIKTLSDGIEVTRYNLVIIRYGYQCWNYVLYKSDITYDEYKSGFNTKFTLVKHNDYIDLFFNLFTSNQINLAKIEEYFLVFYNNIYYSYNFKQNITKEINQDTVKNFLYNKVL